MSDRPGKIKNINGKRCIVAAEVQEAGLDRISAR